MARLILNAWGSTHQITLSIEHYVDNDNLAIEMWCWDDEEFPEPWSMLTVNLDSKRKPNCAFVDTNNNGDDIVNWIINNNLGNYTGTFGYSGYCCYPEFEFNMDELQKYVEKV